METKKKPDTKQEREICRALITPMMDDKEEGWDFEAVAVPTTNKQVKYSMMNNEYFYQVLRTGQGNINTSRMDSGLPLFDNHPEDESTSNQLGITVGYDFTAEGIVMRVKLGARADDALKSDIQNKIVRTVSVQGVVENYIIERKQGEVPVYYADLWEPESLSFAPVPQDISAQIEVKRALADQIEKSKKPETDNSLNNLINKF